MQRFDSLSAISSPTADDMRQLGARTEVLERVFLQIQQERMQDIPILNPALQVRALGFVVAEHANTEKVGFGILLTPWFMNVMLLPLHAVSRNHLDGKTETYLIGEDAFSFISGSEQGIASYQMCSMFSPVLEFQNQQVACETAMEILRHFTSAMVHTEKLKRKEAEIQPGRRAFLRGKVTGST
jgi:[NiFe] hydrogenase assembly HybE family chaperone